MRKIVFLFLFASVFLGFKSKKEVKTNWYKGNTHCHSTISDGDSAPFKVVKAYHDHGYNFLLLTDHNFWVDHDTIRKPQNLRDDFIMIPGEEVTDQKSVHSTAFSISEYVPFNNDKNQASSYDARVKEIRAALKTPTDLSKSDLLQLHVDGTIEAGGIPILNHPNFSQGLHVSDILPVKNLHHMELYNGHPSVANWGKEGHISVEAKWDKLLSSGKKIYGVSADDMHNLVSGNPRKAGLFRGWVMVNAKELTPKSIQLAFANGDFYSSNSVILKTCEMNKKECIVEVDHEATQNEIEDSDGVPRIDYLGNEGYTIEFIGDNGRVLAVSNDRKASYKPQKRDIYVRARITHCTKTEKGYEKLFAWTQPVFVN